jgi:hypothetical protein
MADLNGRKFGKLTAVGASFKKEGGVRFYTNCICECGNKLVVREHNLISGNTSSCGCGKVTDLTGKRFSQLVVIKLSRVDDYGAWWLCRCDCGKEKVIRASTLKSGEVKTCGHRMDLSGERFGKLLVIGKDTSEQIGKRKRVKWVCLCDCGRYTSVSTDNLKYGNTTSCGCLKLTCSVTHGLTGTPTYKVWDHIIQRCNNPNNKKYKDYGGRGITVCEEWLDFNNFVKDMGIKPDGLEIDRVDNSRGYYKDNCRWTTHIENNRNRRNNRTILFNGKVKCISEWAKELGLNVDTIRRRLDRGKSVEEAFSKKKF